IRKEVDKQLKKRGVNILTNTTLDTKSVKVNDDEVTMSITLDDETKTLTAEKLLISVGREANTSDIGLQNTNIEVENGFIETNENYATKDNHIYAIGDCIGGLQL